MKLLRQAVLLSTAIPALVVPSIALAADYEFDAAHSSATFSVRHMMVTDVKGEFGNLTGSLKLDEKDIRRSTVEATIDAKTINTRNEKRDAHLRSPDFFDVEKHPTLTFKSTSVKQAKGDRLAVQGDLTLRGVTRPVTLDVSLPKAEVKDPWGNVKRGATATTKINRKDFGLNWNQALESGGLLVGDEVTITLDVELNKQQPAVVPAAATKN